MHECENWRNGNTNCQVLNLRMQKSNKYQILKFGIYLIFDN
jgi:hypothetical protein